MASTLQVTGDEASDRLLNEDPTALLLGMLLDQQIPMEWAFAGPAKLKERLGGRLDCTEIAAMDPEAVEAVFKEKPALHRFPGSMAKRAHELCRYLVDNYGGDPEDVWRGAASGADALARLKALPGFGEEKSKIFLALLGKRFDAAPEGWREAAVPFSDDEFRSVADIDGPAALEKVRTYKKALKAKGKDKQGRKVS
jgi:uncharacterized HhH-GPD family protein